jgi:hypothetical protein
MHNSGSKHKCWLTVSSHQLMHNSGSKHKCWLTVPGHQLMHNTSSKQMLADCVQPSADEQQWQ